MIAPVRTWETERLIARPPLPEDLPGYRELLGDPAVNHWLQSPPREPFTEAQIREWHDGDLEHWRHFDFGPWVLIRRASGEMVGRGGLHWIELGGERVVEFPWAVGSSHQGQGFATEAVMAAIEWARSLGLDDAVALVEPANLASRRVAEKAGLMIGEEIEYDGVPHLVYRADART